MKNKDPQQNEKRGVSEPKSNSKTPTPKETGKIRTRIVLLPPGKLLAPREPIRKPELKKAKRQAS